MMPKGVAVPKAVEPMPASPVPSGPRLVRALGPLMATAIVVGTVIGSGVFKKPQAVAEGVPYFGLAALAWVLCGLLALLGALAYAEVATLYPRAGGNYVFLREGYGRLAGFLWGWVEFFMIRGASLAALATIFTASFHAVISELADRPVLGFWSQRVVTVSVILGLALVNARGVKWGGGLQLFVTLVKVGSLLFIIALPVLVLLSPALFPATVTPSAEKLTPVWPTGDQLHFGLVGGFASALLAVLWAYHGWMNIAPVAEEVKAPQRNIPLALLGGVGILIALYLGCNMAYCLVLTQDEMKEMKAQTAAPLGASLDPENPKSQIPNPKFHDDTVAIGFSRRLLGSVGVTLAAAAVMCSVFGALNGNILVGPRLLYAMSQDGLAPHALGKVHARYHTPVAAILVLSGWAVLLVVGVAVLTETNVLSPDKDHFDILTDFAMFGAVIFETMAVLSIFVFRRRYPDAPRPYRCWGYPVVPLLYVVLPALIVPDTKDPAPILRQLLSWPSIASKNWVYRQYDHMVRGATLVPPGSDAAVLHIKHDSVPEGSANGKPISKFIAMTVDCNATYVYLDPYEGGKIAVAEAARNLACSGAVPLGATDNLNFGNPHNPEIFYQLRKSVEGLAEACRVFEAPVTGGNVSLYNQNPNGPIDPTPTVALVGQIAKREHITTQWFKDTGDVIVLLGKIVDTTDPLQGLGGSVYLQRVHGLKTGTPPRIDLQQEKRLHDGLRAMIAEGLVKSAHDCSEGGLLVALAECCISHHVARETPRLTGARIDLMATACRMDALLFGETQSRIVITTAANKAEQVIREAEAKGIPAARIGTVTGNTLAVTAAGQSLEWNLVELHDLWWNTIARAMQV